MRPKDQLILLLAQGIGVGRAPAAPGTFGTLLALPLVWALWQYNAWIYAMSAGGLILLAVWISEHASRTLGSHDHPTIVIDEIVGVVVAFAWVPTSVIALVVGFVIFRVFDIAKPPPIGYLDRRVKGGFGIVLDDVVAGVATNLILQLVFRVM